MYENVGGRCRRRLEGVGGCQRMCSRTLEAVSGFQRMSDNVGKCRKMLEMSENVEKCFGGRCRGRSEDVLENAAGCQRMSEDVLVDVRGFHGISEDVG
jgi:hypothetical protein